MNSAHRRHLVSALGALVAVVGAGPARGDAAPNHVREVRIERGAREGSAEVVVSGTSTPTYSARVADGGKLLLVDLRNADVVGATEALTERAGPVGGVLTRAFDSDGARITRVTITLTSPSTYRIRTDGTSLRIALSPSAEGKTGAASGPAFVEARPAKARATVTDVRFERGSSDGAEGCASGCDRVVVDLSGANAYAVNATKTGQLRLELPGADLPDSLARTLDVQAYGGPLRAISTFRDAAKDAVVLEIERGGEARGSVQTRGNALVWSFPRAGAAAAAANKAKDAVDPKRPRSVTVAREAKVEGVPRVERSIRGDEPIVETTEGGAQAGFLSHVNAQLGQGRYTGRRIDLDLKDADIHNILRLLADVGRVNIVTTDEVAGNVTIRMRNVPWDQALDVVLQAKGLGMVRQGNLIRVAPMATLQRERELLLAQQKQEYELTPLETRLIPVSYAQAGELQARAKELLSPRGSLAVDERTNVLIARDIPANLDHVEELVRSLDTQTPQVLVEARIVEATSRYLRDVGIQWGGDVSFSEATGNPTGIAFPSRVSAAGGNYDTQTPTAGLSPFQRNIPNPNFAVNLPATVGTGQGGALGLTFGSVDNTINLGVRLSAAESSGMVRIVSSPRILTLDNREARINQGTLIPFSQISAQGVQTTFQEAKLQLLVRPHVTADGSVAMHVKINRDEPDFNQTSARGDPTILKREAETDLLVMDGHTAVIGGIFTRNTGRNLDQIPFFGDIPILGVLFQRRRANDTRNELVIFLTPRIVNRAEALGR
jgi:type IV pilus assembly protein PilQ